MIRINLMPPEFRKRRSASVSPVFVSTVVGGGLCLAAAAFWAWISFIRVPLAEERLAEAQAALAVADARAKQVEDMESEIAAVEKRADDLDGLLARKVYWVEFLDSFADLLGQQQWTMDGFEVACTELSITPAEGPDSGGSSRRSRTKKKDEALYFQFRWTYQLVGQQENFSGDYVRSFFESILASRFWSEHDMLGKPTDGFTGDEPEWNAAIERVVIEEDLTFTRRHRPVIGEREAP